MTAAVGVPRLVCIEHPPGLLFGAPGDAGLQRRILHETVLAFNQVRQPGEIIHLPYKWQGRWKPAKTRAPIAAYLRRHPWELPRLFKREVPPAGTFQPTS